ncbi:uncharacterized protein PITG_23021 [Phytophthora infestans T30-4]|uniref:Uncharacterized protein n=1 Tax=Phytophthora infestans (strain T30-4) TaxID=403677 RepID=D0NQI8_PHYIT|nr:uncharacterized protein PITG_23021 [Phytophthora infestans T30-4]EEY62936.1 conserved hypothetical protein [Phytophthora infestans T30-4]|eukprot:XP_002898459.1 conserved hypothetical protein [Phytophthora infestans T30-4]
MTHRRAFWEWALHAPLVTAAAMPQRRKLKMRAVQARWAFTSICIETWGFYAFLEMLEKRPEMYWLGGQPGRATRHGRPYNGPIAEDLATLKQKDKERYGATLENALDPSNIDTYGYPSMRSLFESTDALNPDADEKSRLSLAALARVRRDTMSSTKPNVTWAGEKNEEPWQALVNNHAVKLAQDDIMAQITAGTYEVPTVRPPSGAERRRDEWSDSKMKARTKRRKLRPMTLLVTTTRSPKPMTTKTSRKRRNSSSTRTATRKAIRTKMRTTRRRPPSSTSLRCSRS